MAADGHCRVVACGPLANDPPRSTLALLQFRPDASGEWHRSRSGVALRLFVGRDEFRFALSRFCFFIASLRHDHPRVYFWITSTRSIVVRDGGVVVHSAVHVQRLLSAELLLGSGSQQVATRAPDSPIRGC